MASCVLCASFEMKRTNARFTTTAEAQIHATQHLFQTKLFDGDCITSDQMFEQCFPTLAVAPVVKKKKMAKSEGRQLLLDLCRNLLKGRISKASPCVPCQKCGTMLDLWSKSGSAIMLLTAVNHAAAHLGIDLFECQKCGRSFQSRNAIQGHLTSSHNLRALSEYFTDKSNDFMDEISASIKECFSKCARLSDKKPPFSLYDESRVRCTTKGSKLAVERQLFCYRLIRQRAGDDVKIQCRYCSKKIGVMKGSVYDGSTPLKHAQTHLQKPLYKCKVCTNVQRCYSSMQWHLMSAHTLPMAENYECTADEFYAEIISMLRKCYSKDLESN